MWNKGNDAQFDVILQPWLARNIDWDSSPFPPKLTYCTYVYDLWQYVIWLYVIMTYIYTHYT